MAAASIIPPQVLVASNSPSNGPNPGSVAQYQAQANAIPGTYQGNDAPYKGETWGVLYSKLLKLYPKLSPQQIYLALSEIYQAQVIGGGVTAGTGRLGQAVQGAENALSLGAVGNTSTGAARGVVAVALEVAGVIVLSIVAGSNDKAGKAIVWFFLSLWVIYLVTNGSNIFTKFNTALAKVNG